MSPLRPSRAFAFFVLATLAGACSSANPSADGAEADSSNEPSATGALILNEILANEPGTDTNAEFVEVVNTGSSDVVLAGFSLWDSQAERHAFSGTLAAGHALVVFGGAAANPGGLSNAVASSTGTLSLGNGGDTVTLKDGTGAVLDTLTYTSALAVDGVSANRASDASGSAAWVLHTKLSSLKDSPGVRVDGSPFGGVTSRDGGAPVDAGRDSGTHDGGTDASTDAGAHDAGDAGGPQPDSGSAGSFRMLAGNLSSGKDQSYNPGEGQRILEALHPDIALLQEMNYGASDDAAIRGFVTATFGASFTYSWQSGVQIPNIVVSRFPIVSAGTWTDSHVANRGYTWAQIDIPGGHDLWAVSVHLLTTSSGNRAAEATELVGLLKANVPSGDYVAVGGDWNTGSRTEACATTFGALTVTTAPYPDDQSGNSDTSENRNDPHDWLVVSPALNAFQVPTVEGSVTRPNGLVFDTRVFTPLSSAPPALVGDSNPSDGMQHMAVVKDYVIH